MKSVTTTESYKLEGYQLEEKARNLLFPIDGTTENKFEEFKNPHLNDRNLTYILLTFRLSKYILIFRSGVNRKNDRKRPSNLSNCILEGLWKNTYS